LQVPFSLLSWLPFLLFSLFDDLEHSCNPFIAVEECIDSSIISVKKKTTWWWKNRQQFFSAAVRIDSRTRTQMTLDHPVLIFNRVDL